MLQTWKWHLTAMNIIDPGSWLDHCRFNYWQGENAFFNAEGLRTSLHLACSNLLALHSTKQTPSHFEARQGMWLCLSNGCSAMLLSPSRLTWHGPRVTSVALSSLSIYKENYRQRARHQWDIRRQKPGLIIILERETWVPAVLEDQSRLALNSLRNWR